MAQLGTSLAKKEDSRREALLAIREPVEYCCEGCGRVDKNDISLCTVYISPDVMWSRGICPLSTHVKTEAQKSAEKIRVGQQKQKKKTRK